MLLRILHMGYSPQDQKPLFKVVRDEDEGICRSVTLNPPNSVEVIDHNINLRDGLKWYLEEYLEIPEGPYREQADDVCETLKAWGEECFELLFGIGEAMQWFQKSCRDGLANLNLVIESSDPKILSWPWEALYNPDEGYIALKCCIVRQISNISRITYEQNVKRAEQLNILYIIARPYGDQDADYCVLIRPLIDLIQKQNLPIHIDVLRPPTFKMLKEVLNNNPGFYHIIHFDGHGGYGKLIFENDNISHEAWDEVNAKELGKTLRESAIPIMVLNACRSATIDEQVEDSFASVSASLLIAGIRNVVAMSYSLYISGAREFVPTFYKKLFESGNITEALRAGRQEMFENDKRICFTGMESLQDWIIPVLYEHQASNARVMPILLSGMSEKRTEDLPSEVLLLGTNGFIGRDKEILFLERGLRQPYGGILVHGMAGEGKTTLVKGFLQWLAATNGLGEGVFWFSFEDIHSAKYVINKLVDSLYGIRAMALQEEEKVKLIIQTLNDRPFLLVWDNFESASGISNTEIHALLPEEDRIVLKSILQSLYGGKSKVLITSRSHESWLTNEECLRVSLHGLHEEELWEYCKSVADTISIDLRRNTAFRALMEKLEGNPLAIHVILSQMAIKSAEELLQEVDDNLIGLEGDSSSIRIRAALDVFEKGLDKCYIHILQLLGLHEHFVDVNYLEYMLVDTDYDEECVLINSCFIALENAGLCLSIGNKVFQIHPALHSYLLRKYTADKDLCLEFVKGFMNIAGLYASKELGDWFLFEQQCANIYKAIELANHLDIPIASIILKSGMAIYALNTRNFSEAESLNIELVETIKEYGGLEKYESDCYHQLGNIAELRRDLKLAKSWYEKSLAIKLKFSNEQDAAITYQQLGLVAQEQYDIDAAEDYYKKSLEIKLKYNDEDGAVYSYHQLGRIAVIRGDLDTAEIYSMKALAIENKLDNELMVAGTYHQLGMIAHERKDLDSAENWYKKAYSIACKYNDEYHIAITLHQLGRIAEDRGDLNLAEERYKKALLIELEIDDEFLASGIYHQLGMIAQKKRDFIAAEGWYNKSMAISIKQDNENQIAKTYFQLGNLAVEQGDINKAKKKYMKAYMIFVKLKDEDNAKLTFFNMISIGFPKNI